MFPNSQATPEWEKSQNALSYRTSSTTWGNERCPRTLHGHQITTRPSHNSWLNCSKYTGTIYFDLSQAFDKIWHNELIFKLMQVNTPNNITRNIQSFTTNKIVHVRIDNTRSSIVKMTAGVTYLHPPNNVQQHTNINSLAHWMQKLENRSKTRAILFSRWITCGITTSSSKAKTLNGRTRSPI